MHEDVCQQGLFFARKELAPVVDLVVEGGGEAVDVTLPQLPPASRTLALHFAAAGAADEVAGGAAGDGQLPRHGEAGAALHTSVDYCGLNIIMNEMLLIGNSEIKNSDNDN